MLKRVSILRAAATVIALATFNALSSHSQAAPPGQLGLVSLSDNPTAGGQLSYQFNVEVFTPGTLVFKAKVVSKPWKATFPDLTTTPAVGVTEGIAGTSVSIPSTFTGSAVLRVKAKLNGKKLGARAIPFTVGAPPSPMALTVSTNLYDVGFENIVTLPGSIVPTSDLSGALTYSWTQTGGKAVTLSASNVLSPSFTTDALTNFVMTGTAIYNNDIDDFGYTNALYVTPEHRFGSVSGIAMDAEQTGTLGATYNFRLLVSNGSVTRTGLVTVACSMQTPAHPNIPLGVTAYYKGATNSANWSLISKPDGSTATLKHTGGLIAELRPDVEGVYIVQDGTTGKSVTNTAASWTGLQFCAICHGPGNNVGQKDLVTPWKQTAHASFFQRAIDGQTSAGQFYNQNCIACHTVGVNKSPAADNGGFDDVAKALGWKFPSPLKPGNYAAMPDELKNLANIQCESCHGPGSRHPGSPSISLDVKVCATCHQDGNHHVRPVEWEISPHAGAYEAIGARGFGSRQDCARCHSPIGFTAIYKGDANVTQTNTIPVGVGPLTCQTCHDPHDTHGDNPDRHQLRIYDDVLLGNPYFRSNTFSVALGENLTTADPRLTNSNLVVTDTGASAACIVCHNGRQLPTQVQLYGSNAGKMFFQTGGPHDQTAGEAFLGMGMYDYGQTMGNSFHTYLADCQSCHMYQLRAPVNNVAQDTISIDDVATPVTAAIYSQFETVLGDHTFKMDYPYVDTNGVQHVADNIAACNQCHASFEPVDSFDFKSVFGRDYDGNGVAEGVQTETLGMLNNLANMLRTTGLTVSTSSLWSVSGTYSTNAVIQAAQRKAAWNILACRREGSFGVHNTQYTTRLLQTSYTDLSTNYFSDVTKTYQAAFPNAFLR